MKSRVKGDRLPVIVAKISHNQAAVTMVQTGIRIGINEAMTEDYISGVAEAISKVARHYAV